MLNSTAIDLRLYKIFKIRESQFLGSLTFVYQRFLSYALSMSRQINLLSRRSRQRERLSASMLSICLFVCLLVCLSVCLFVCLAIAKIQKTRFSQKLSNFY